MSKKPKGKMFPKTAAMHAYRLWSLGRINGPDQHPDQLHLPLEVPAETGPRLLPYVLYAVADPDGTVTVPLSELCLMVGHAPRTVERWRARIRGLGFLAKVSNGNRYAAAVYLLTLPDWAASQMEERYPGTFEPASRAATQDGASTPSQSGSRAATQDGASTPGVQILEPPSERLEPPSPRLDCRLTDKEGDSLRSSVPPQPPKPRDPSVAAPDGADRDHGDLVLLDTIDTPAHTFDDFWRMAVRKTGKGTAARAYRRALRHTTPDTLMAAWVQANTAWATWPDKTVVPHPTTWLNGRRWDDDPVQPRGLAAPASAVSKLESTANLAQRMRAEEAAARPRLAEGGRW